MCIHYLATLVSGRHISDKGLVSKIYKELLLLHNNTIKKRGGRGRDLSICFTKKDVTMVNKLMKKMLDIISHSGKCKLKLNTTICMCIRMIKFGKDMEQLKFSHLSCDLAIPLVGIYPEKLNIYTSTQRLTDEYSW